MENNTLGDNIARFRKAAGLTQEELGTTVGVSAQAVSRWECGGAPDVALLPAIADALGVSIDSLFGREPGAQIDVERVVARWLNTFPEEERPDRFCRLLFSSINSLMPENLNLPKMNYLETANGDGLGDSDGLMYTQFWFKGGILLDVHAEDLSFATVWPRPEKGYDAYFAPRDLYRKLFAVLSRPGRLELLEYLHSQKFRMYVPENLAKVLKLPLEEVRTILDELCELRIIRKEELQLEEKISNAYYQYNSVELVPFLYMARCMMWTDGHLVNVGDGDGKPLLEGREWKEEKEKKDEKK